MLTPFQEEAGILALHRIMLKYYPIFKVLIHPGSVQSVDLGDVPVRQESALNVTEDLMNSVTFRTTTTSSNPRGVNMDMEHESRKVECGYDILDNNAVNILMAAIMSIGGMAVAGYVWDVPLSTVLN
jgi:hypothetical protein